MSVHFHTLWRPKEKLEKKFKKKQTFSFVKLKFFREIATYTSRLLPFDKFFPIWPFLLNKKTHFLKLFLLIALYGARVRGSVFKMKFRVLSREFESIETLPGFAQLLGENWN